jgi:Putative auto-transporter adhesin, head GIN domain
MASTSASLPSGRTPHPLRMAGFAALAVLVVAAIVVGVSSRWHTGPSSAGNAVMGSGTPATESREVAPFTSVDLAGSNHVSIGIGAERSVSVRADDNLIDLVTTRVRDGQLVIDNRRSFQTKSPMSVRVTLPELVTVTMSGSGTVAVDGVRAQTLTVRLPGSGTIRVSGAADRLTAILDGSGELQLSTLVAARVTAGITGSGTIQLYASESVDASVSGSGTIAYRGNPQHVSKDVTGSGAIIEQ